MYERNASPATPQPVYAGSSPGKETVQKEIVTATPASSAAWVWTPKSHRGPIIQDVWRITEDTGRFGSRSHPTPTSPCVGGGSTSS